MPSPPRISRLAPHIPSSIPRCARHTSRSIAIHLHRYAQHGKRFPPLKSLSHPDPSCQIRRSHCRANGTCKHKHAASRLAQRHEVTRKRSSPASAREMNPALKRRTRLQVGRQVQEQVVDAVSLFLCRCAPQHPSSRECHCQVPEHPSPPVAAKSRDTAPHTAMQDIFVCSEWRPAAEPSQPDAFPRRPTLIFDPAADADVGVGVDFGAERPWQCGPLNVLIDRPAYFPPTQVVFFSRNEYSLAECSLRFRRRGAFRWN